MNGRLVQRRAGRRCIPFRDRLGPTKLGIRQRSKRARSDIIDAAVMTVSSDTALPDLPHDRHTVGGPHANPPLPLMHETVPPLAVDPVIDPVKQARALDERRVLGAYYTPERLSQLLADWAIRTLADTVLEPSFGGCGFLSTARDTLAARGSANPVGQIFGCDIDPVAFQYLANVFGAPVGTDGFVLRDFLDCIDVETWPNQFSVVLANPPYIPHHRIGQERVRALSRYEHGIAGVGGRASLWAYFIAHAVSLLAPGGRMAWVLPGAFLQADYAEPIRSYLGKHFDRCAAFLVRERLFLTEGTDEETVILLADGHRVEPHARGIEVGEASTLGELESLITRWAGLQWEGTTEAFSPAALSLTPDVKTLFAHVRAAAGAVTFGSIAKVQIGLVTGDNRFFVLDRPGCQSAGLTDGDCLRVLSKFKAAPGIVLTRADLDAYDVANGRSFLISETEPDVGSAVAIYLDGYDAERRKNVSTFKKRSIWSATSDGKIPDAFFPVMHHTGPRLVLNPNQFNCTNTIHRVFFLDTVDEARRQLIALSLLTTFSQISAELCGRRYGSGVLKHEPRDAERIEIILPGSPSVSQIAKVYEKVDSCLRSGDAAGARSAADDAILSWAGVDLSPAQRCLMTDALGGMRLRRRPNRISASARSTSAPTQLSR